MSDILNAFYTNDVLKSSLVLKGGTAINLTVFNMPRLSVDIDLDFCKDVDRDGMLSERVGITECVNRIMVERGYALSPHSKEPHSLDSWVYEYTNMGGNKDVIKIEINYSMRCHVLPYVTKLVGVDYLEPFDVVSLHPMELFGSKIKAMIERGACRDLYDVNNMINSGLFDSVEEKDLLRKIVIWYMCVGGVSVLSNEIDLSKIRKMSFPKIRSQLNPVLKKTERFDFEQAKNRVCDYVTELMKPTRSEAQFIENFSGGKFVPELLFEDEEIVKRISNHPMAQWKIKNLLQK